MWIRAEVYVVVFPALGSQHALRTNAMRTRRQGEDGNPPADRHIVCGSFRFLRLRLHLFINCFSLRIRYSNLYSTT